MPDFKDIPVISSFKGKNRFLSNFFPCEIEYQGIIYPTTEHAYQATKTLDLIHRKEISELSKPGDAKKWGKAVWLRDDWDKIKLSVMYEISWLKYEQEEFQKLLLNTYPAILQEGNTWGDTFWGICKGQGLNHLGKILMTIRFELRDKGN